MNFIRNCNITLKTGLLISITLFCTNIFSQNLDSIKVLWHKNELARAKESIDDYLLHNEQSSDAWLTKAGIYNDISKNPTYQSLFPDCLTEAFNCVKSAIASNENSSKIILQKSNFKLLNEIYDGFTINGIGYFNAGIENQEKSNFEKSFDLFKKAEAVAYFNNTLKSTVYILDTNNLYYLTMSAIYAEKENDAGYYSRKVVDNNITSTVVHKDFQVIYQWLVYFLRSEKRVDLLLKYSSIANKLYPNSDYFDLNYIDWLHQSKEYSKTFAIWKDLFERGFDTKANRYSYLFDLFKFVYENKSVTTNQFPNSEMLLNELSSYLAKYPSDDSGKLLIAKYYINEGAYNQHEFKMKNHGSLKNSNYTKQIISDLKMSNQYLQSILHKEYLTKKIISYFKRSN